MKKAAALSVLLLCGFFLPALAQNKTSKKSAKTPPVRGTVTIKLPPAPARPSEEDALAWHEFASEKFGFWITFPSDKDDVFADDEESISNFRASTRKARYGLSVKNLLVSLNNSQLDEMFEKMISETEDETTKLMGKRDVYLNGVLGKELVYEENEQIVFGRFYIVESKLFMLTVSLPKKQYNKNFDRWATKFFDSFGVKINSKMDA